MICGICNRKLKDRKSIEQGYGPICYRKIMPVPEKTRKISNSEENGALSPNYNVPGQMELSDFFGKEIKDD